MVLKPENPVIIIGAGPCGLAAARRLDDLGHKNWTIVEKNGWVGGLAASFTDPRGFTWDLGGHVVFSHYGEFDRLLDEVMGEEVIRHERRSYVRILGTWVPYPFQNNLRYLPPEAQLECLLGLKNAVRDGVPRSFEEWIHASFGEGIARYFMIPYNRKVWAAPLAGMSHGWISERVSVVDFDRLLSNVILGRDDVGWGPNSRFAFPLRGATGEIFRRLAARLGPERLRLGAEAVEIDPAAKTIRLTDGGVLPYEMIINTSPLDILASRVKDAPADVVAAARRLEHNSVTVVGVGLKGPQRDEKCWMYFPEADQPYYRTTNFSHYSPNNVPGGDTGRFHSYMCEVAHSEHKPEDTAALPGRVVESLPGAGLADPCEIREPASLYETLIPYAYPIPTLGRDAALSAAQPYLESLGILSRGRFGSWLYEIGNMDHAVKMGFEAAERLVADGAEKVWRSA